MQALWFLLRRLCEQQSDDLRMEQKSDDVPLPPAPDDGFHDPSGVCSRGVACDLVPRCTVFKLTKHGVGCPPRAAPRVEGIDTAHVFESYTGNSWGTLKKRLASSKALVLCAQEIGFDEDRLGERVSSAEAMGWNLLCSPAAACAQGQAPAGVAILARVTVGLRRPGFLPRGTAVGHRLVFAMIDIPKWPPLLVGSACLYT
eukprot:3478185-Pyramimonas_sp.AAC.1